MPKTAIHKHRDLGPGKGDVEGTARDCGREDADAESEPKLEEFGAKGFFGSSVRASNGPHPRSGVLWPLIQIPRRPRTSRPLRRRILSRHGKRVTSNAAGQGSGGFLTLAEHTETVNFTVDAALLRELGERLVGRPAIALAELIKNSYDADATEVAIEFTKDSIVVSDNGHGMSRDEFEHRWMRVGSPQKASERVSRRLKRTLTGSKGIGRLAAQFLGRTLVLTTAAEDAGPELHATIDWQAAFTAGDLTTAQAFLTTRAHTTSGFPSNSPHGTTIRIGRLTRAWTTDDVTDLARQIWWLQPPFHSGTGTTDFHVSLRAHSRAAEREFGTQMQRVLDLWHARIVGRYLRTASDNGVAVSLQFSGEDEVTRATYPPPGSPPVRLNEFSFEIRIYDLMYKQPFGIRVGEARDYLKHYGGVHLYDSGFHVPYYGPNVDWLGIEMDHSHRLSQSKFLPPGLQVTEGLNFLPTNSRIFGVVQVSTTREREAAGAGSSGPGSHLEIQVSRDRLVDNAAFEQLRGSVRWALDFYATRMALRALAEAHRIAEVVPLERRLGEIPTDVAIVIRSLPDDVRAPIDDYVSGLRGVVAAEVASAQKQIAVLGPMATAGLLAMAYQHEFAKRLVALGGIADKLDDVWTAYPDANLRNVAEEIRSWISVARDTERLFLTLGPVADEQNAPRLRALPLLAELVRALHPLLRGTDVDLSGLDPTLRLPQGTAAQWTALLQNAVVNAANAVLDTDRRRIAIDSVRNGSERHIRIMDTGVGVDVDSSDSLFAPFKRRAPTSEERRWLGYGGSGLGLAIARLIAQDLRTEVKFVTAPPDFSTCLDLTWEEQQ